jgi:hypothetical protein
VRTQYCAVFVAVSCATHTKSFKISKFSTVSSCMSLFAASSAIDVVNKDSDLKEQIVLKCLIFKILNFEILVGHERETAVKVDGHSSRFWHSSHRHGQPDTPAHV